MTRIIKLTEGQLRDVVSRIVNEQQASPNASQAAKQIWTKLSQAQAGAGGAGGTDERALVQAISMIKSVQLYTEVVNMMRGGSSIGTYKSIVQLLNGELESDNLKEFQQIQAILKKIGVTLTAQTRKTGQHVGAERGATYQYDTLVPGSIRQVVSKTPAPTPVPTQPVPDNEKPIYKECKGFPIRYGCKQAEVGEIQRCLGLKVDYSFGPSTLNAWVNRPPKTEKSSNGAHLGGLSTVVIKKMVLRDGIDSKQYYYFVKENCKAKPKPKPKPKPGEKPVVDTRTPAPNFVPQKRSISDLAPLPVNVNLPKLAAVPTPGVDPARKQAIIAQIKDRGFDQIYKGQALTPEEKQWLDYYMSINYGSQVDKTKPKGDDQEKIRYDNR